MPKDDEPAEEADTVPENLRGTVKIGKKEYIAVPEGESEDGKQRGYRFVPVTGGRVGK